MKFQLSSDGSTLSVGTAWNWGRFFRVFIAVVLLPNTIFFSVSIFFDVVRPVVNFDYVCVAFLFVIGWRWFGFLLLVVAFAFDSLALISQVFPVLRLSDVFYLLNFISVAPIYYKFSALIGLVVLVITCGIFFRVVRASSKLETLTLVNALVLIFLIEVFFGQTMGGEVWKVSGSPNVASQLVFSFDSRNTGFIKELSGEGEAFANARTSSVTSSLFDKQPKHSILLVVSESWGVTSNEILEEIVSPLLNEPGRLTDFERGELAFDGITISAEFRELCQLHPNHFNFEGEGKRLSNCLPNLLKKLGYKTYAFHGAGGLMYDRINWYPRVGFEEMTFFESRTWERRCYSFPGACDADMASEVKRSFSGHGKVFSYWLTLNTHSIYDARDIRRDYFNCSEYEIPENLQTCRNLKLHAQFFRDLKKLIDSPELDGVEVIVVGDHEPLIFDKKEKEKYFVEGKVPWIKFKVGNLSS